MLKDIEKQFDKKFGYKFNVGVVPDDITKQEIKSFLKNSIKQVIEEIKPERITGITHVSNECGRFPLHSWNRCLDQLEENYKKFIG